MRYFLRAYAEKVIEQSNSLKRLDEMSSDNGLAAMTIARTMPYFPSGILTALGAVSKMSIRDYCIATFIGKFPSTAIEVVLGHGEPLGVENVSLTKEKAGWDPKKTFYVPDEVKTYFAGKLSVCKKNQADWEGMT